MLHLMKDCFIMVIQTETKVNLPFSVKSDMMGFFTQES